MKSQKISNVLSLPVFMIIVILFISLIVISGSYYVHQNIKKEYKKTQHMLRNVKLQLKSIDETKDTIRNYFPRTQQLHQQGIIGSGDRLHWTEILVGLKEQFKFKTLYYEIAPEKVFQADLGIEKGRFEIFTNTMLLKLELLHEGDLQDFFTELKTRYNGIINITECTLSQAAKTSKTTTDTTNLKVKCILEWLNIDLAGETKLRL